MARTPGPGSSTVTTTKNLCAQLSNCATTSVLVPDRSTRSLLGGVDYLSEPHDSASMADLASSSILGNPSPFQSPEDSLNQSENDRIPSASYVTAPARGVKNVDHRTTRLANLTNQATQQHLKKEELHTSCLKSHKLNRGKLVVADSIDGKMTEKSSQGDLARKFDIGKA